jgi:hypothetical protein
MCTADNVYYTVCGCWLGNKVRHTCAIGEVTNGSCRDLEVSGVLREDDTCTPCKRRRAQAKRTFPDFDSHDVDMIDLAQRVLLDQFGKPDPSPRPEAEKYTLTR